MLDLSKAFDLLDPSILLEKLKYYGVRGITNKWIESFLTNRKIQVRLDNTDSEIFEIELASPQGGVLSPLLFEILINDLPNCLKYSKSILFADDTTIWNSGHAVKVTFAQLKHDFNNVLHWLRTNRLFINIGKSALLHFKGNYKCKSFTPNLEVNGIRVPLVHSTKFLGIIIDDNVSWIPHIDQLNKKLSFALYQLRKVKHFLPLHVKKMLYYSQYYSHLSYGISTWGSMLTENKKQKLKVLQNRAICILCGLKEHGKLPYPLKSYYKRNNILMFEEIIKVEQSKIAYRYMNDLLSDRLIKLFELPKHKYNTRNRHNLRPKLFHKNIYSKSFMYACPSLWVDLPENLKISTLSTFKKNIKCHYLSKY